MKSFLRRYWIQVLFFSLAIICDACMDYINFQIPYDSGFWSLHTGGLRFDVWHILKVIKWTFVAFGMIPKLNWLILAGALNLFWHELIYHKILKRR